MGWSFNHWKKNYKKFFPMVKTPAHFFAADVIPTLDYWGRGHLAQKLTQNLCLKRMGMKVFVEPIDK